MKNDNDNDGGRCDSCNSIVDVLVPIRMLNETRNGILEMQLRHYCPKCFSDIIDDWMEPENEEGSDDELDEQWIVAWFVTNGFTQYEVYSIKELAEEAYEKILKQEDVEEAVLGRITKRDLRVERSE